MIKIKKDRSKKGKCAELCEIDYEGSTHINGEKWFEFDSEYIRKLGLLLKDKNCRIKILPYISNPDIGLLLITDSDKVYALAGRG